MDGAALSSHLGRKRHLSGVIGIYQDTFNQKASDSTQKRLYSFILLILKTSSNASPALCGHHHDPYCSWKPSSPLELYMHIQSIAHITTLLTVCVCKLRAFSPVFITPYTSKKADENDGYNTTLVKRIQAVMGGSTGAGVIQWYSHGDMVDSIGSEDAWQHAGCTTTFGAATNGGTTIVIRRLKQWWMAK